jgi:hypothetical protein
VLHLLRNNAYTRVFFIVFFIIQIAITSYCPIEWSQWLLQHGAIPTIVSELTTWLHQRDDSWRRQEQICTRYDHDKGTSHVNILQLVHDSIKEAAAQNQDPTDLMKPRHYAGWLLYGLVSDGNITISRGNAVP